jgi:hypothetical protein
MDRVVQDVRRCVRRKTEKKSEVRMLGDGILVDVRSWVAWAVQKEIQKEGLEARMVVV